MRMPRRAGGRVSADLLQAIGYSGGNRNSDRNSDRSRFTTDCAETAADTARAKTPGELLSLKRVQFPQRFIRGCFRGNPW
jgi:hypothetical protein